MDNIRGESATNKERLPCLECLGNLSPAGQTIGICSPEVRFQGSALRYCSDTNDKSKIGNNFNKCKIL